MTKTSSPFEESARDRDENDSDATMSGESTHDEQSKAAEFPDDSAD